VQILGGGNLTVTPGSVIACGLQVKSAGSGWSMLGGLVPYLADNTGNGYVSCKYYKAAGMTGQSDANVELVVGIRNNGGTIEKCTRRLRFDGGIMTEITSVSAWTPI